MNKVKEKKAIYGEKMIEVKVRFFTNDIANSKDNILPKHAWTNGMIRIMANDSHGIVPDKEIPFNSLSDISAGIEKCLVNNGIKLHISQKMSNVIETD